MSTTTPDAEPASGTPAVPARTVPAKPPATVAAVVAYARQHGWTAMAEWSPADETNTGDGWVVTTSADTARGRGEFRLVWRYQGAARVPRYERYFSHGRSPSRYSHAPTLPFVRWAMRNNPIHSKAAGDEPPVWRWREPDALPPTAEDLTEVMLAPIRRSAEHSWLPQTVYASRWIGRDYVGQDCLLISAAMPCDDYKPEDVHPDSPMPLLTILPTFYFGTVPTGG
ncbi:hypothetical protein ACIA8O_00740 [Kitasatospora sp. NPDC051853]|uniref:hypothetical protein n=1 Tax=Kitasatospora sp. NPDC051853 TaxID=3364058 RepID=UPI00378A1C71